MSTTVDKRVVSMEFDNQRFERNIHKSMKSLDEMNDKLKFEDAGKGLKNLTDSLNKTDFSNLENSLSHIEKRFSTIGIIGGSLVHRLTNDAIDAVNSVMHLFTAPIKKMSGMIYSGGLSRSMNIEKAKFQLEGLGVTWTSIFGDIDYAVTNTAYALDSAAVAASQLVASGVQIGNDLTPQLRELGYTGEIGAEGLDSMAVSLKAISGVAAQTSSDYDSIAHIFTTVAGQGRLMTMQLRQLEMRGLNVAAKIGEVIGATEAQVREMVSKGMIDYETFANSMFTLFADHAAEANKTLSGVTANIKAAFSRIGADFINPIIKNEGPLVEMLEQIRKRINYIKKALTDWKRGALLDDKAVADATSILEGITAAIKRLPIQNVVVIMNAIGKIYSGLSTMVKNLKPFFKAIKDDFAELFPKKHTIRDVWLFGEKVKAVLSNIKYIHEYTNNIAEVGKDGIMRIVEVTSEKVDPKLDKVRRTLKGIAAAFSILKQAVEVVLAPIKTFIKIFFKGDSLFLTATASLGDFLVGIDKFIKDSGIFVKAGEKLSWVVEKVVGGFVRLKDGFLNGMSIMDRRSGRMMDIGSIFASMTPDMGLVEKLGMGISAAFGFIGNAFTFVKDKIGGVIDRFRGLNKEGSTTAELIEGLKSKKRLLEKIPYIVKLALNFVKDKIAAIKEAAPGLLEKAKEGFGNLKEAIDPVVTSIGEFISTLGSDAIKKFVEWFSAGTTIIQNNSDKIGSGFDKVRNVLHDILEFIRTEAANGFETLTSALGNFVNSGYAGKILDFAERLIKMRIGWKFGTFLGQTGMLNEKIAGVMGKVSETINKFLHPIQSKRGKKNPFKKIADIMLEVAASIGIITASMLLIANTPQDKLDKAIGVMIDIFAMYALLGITMRKSNNGLNVGGKGLISMAISILIISTAIKKLANGIEDPGRLGAATAAIIGVMAAMMIFMERITKMGLGTNVEEFTTVTKAMGKFMKRMAGTLILLSVGIASLWIPVKIFGSMDKDELIKGGIVTGTILVLSMAFAAAIAALSRGQTLQSGLLQEQGVIMMDQNVHIGPVDADVIKQLGKTLSRIAGSMIVLAAGISAIAIPIKIFGNMLQEDPDVFAGGAAVVGTISGIVATLYIIIGLLSTLDQGEANKYDVKIIRRLSAALGEIAGGMIVLAGAITAMYIPIKLLGELPNLDKGTKVVYTILGGTALFITTLAALTRTGSKFKLTDKIFKDGEVTGSLNNVTRVILATSVAFIGIAAAIKIMASAMTDIGNIPNFDNAYKAITTILGIIAGVTLIIAVVAALLGRGNRTVTKNSGNNNKLLSGNTGFSFKDIFHKGAFKNLFKNVGIFNLGTAGRVAVIIASVAGIIASIGGAVILIANAMKTIESIDESIDETKFSKSVLTVGGIFGAISVLIVYLTLISRFMGKGTTVAVAGTFIAIAASLSILALSIGQVLNAINGISLSSDAIASVGVTLAAFGVALGALVAIASLPVIGTAVKFGLLAVAGAIALIGISVLGAGKGFEAFVDGLKKFSEATKQNLPIVISAIDENIAKACGVILKSGALIAGTIVGVIGEALATVAATSFEFGATAAAIIAGLCTGFSSQVTIVVEALIDLTVKALNALADALNESGSEMISAIARVVKSIIDAIVDGINDFFKNKFSPDSDSLISAGKRMGNSIATGIKSGMSETLFDDSSEIGSKNIVTSSRLVNIIGAILGVRKGAKIMGSLGDFFKVLTKSDIANIGVPLMFGDIIEQNFTGRYDFSEEDIKKASKYRELWLEYLRTYFPEHNFDKSNWYRLQADAETFQQWLAWEKELTTEEIEVYKEFENRLSGMGLNTYTEADIRHLWNYVDEYEEVLVDTTDGVSTTLEESGDKVESKWPGYLNKLFGGTKIGELIEKGKTNLTSIFSNLLPSLNITSVLGGGDGNSFFGALLNNFGVAFLGTDPVGDAKETAEEEKEKAQKAYDAMIAELSAADSPMTYTSARVLEDIEKAKQKREREEAEAKWRDENPEEAAALDARRVKKREVIQAHQDKTVNWPEQLKADRDELAKIESALGLEDELADDNPNHLPSVIIEKLKNRREELITEINDLKLKTAQVTDVYIGYKDELDLLNEKIQNGEGLALAVDSGGPGTLKEAEEKKDEHPISAQAQKIADDINHAKEIVAKYADNPLIGEAIKVIYGIQEDTEEATESATKAVEDLESATKRAEEVATTVGPRGIEKLKELAQAFEDSKRHYGNWYDEGEENFILDPIDNKVNDKHKWEEIITSFKDYSDQLREQPRLAFDMHSPSKEMEKDGENVILGWVRGVTLSEGYGVSQTRTVFQKIRDAVSEVVEKINTLTEGGEDFSPTITPVLDLSGVEKQSGMIASILGNDYTLHIASDINKAVQEIQNGRQLIIDAINGINTKLDKLPHLTNNYTIEGITVDEGSSTADAIDLLTNEAIRYRRA